MWRDLKEKIRELNKMPKILETYVLTAPVFYFKQPIGTIGEEDELGISVRLRHAFIKSVFAEEILKDDYRSGHSYWIISSYLALLETI